MIAALTARGIRVPDGFATTAAAYRRFLAENGLEELLKKELNKLEGHRLTALAETGEACRRLVSAAPLPADLEQSIRRAYRELSGEQDVPVAVRSSATAEDLPTASFAGQHDSFLNIRGEEDVVRAVKRCYISLFNDRAIKYREDHGFGHLDVALSAGVQLMIRSDLGSAGVAFTIDPESGFKNVVYLTSSWGLGENVVQGAVSPDEFYLFKPFLAEGRPGIFHHKTGEKETTVVFSDEDTPTKTVVTPPEKRGMLSLSDYHAGLLGAWCLEIENHYGMPMDIEWALDGLTNQLYIVQARPETVHRGEGIPELKEYTVKSAPEPLCSGQAVGRAVVSGPARLIRSLNDAHKVRRGDIIVADITNPDWNALLRKAVSIVTNKGGRTSHASIVARELGIHAVVGTGDATEKLSDGQLITVSCAEGDTGFIYNGRVEWEERNVSIDVSLPRFTNPMFILADPSKAFRLSHYPNAGVGLLRLEFIIAQVIRVHPMALVRFSGLPEGNDKQAIAAITVGYADKRKYFIEKLSEAVAVVAAAFYPKEVIVRLSDFKTNEYARLIGGSFFETGEENPMLGFRGASRYYHERYREGFALECEAIRRVRDDMGFVNVKVMIPFCRTPEEGRKVVSIMEQYGLKRGSNGLEVYVMAEIPSNVILADEFAEIFDGFSIGSNDLTQLTLGIDRDSAVISDLFDENHEAVRKMLREVILAAKRNGRKIGLCGQAPSDRPEFAGFLVTEGIDSISFNPDALLRGMENIRKAEAELEEKTALVALPHE